MVEFIASRWNLGRLHRLEGAGRFGREAQAIVTRYSQSLVPDLPRLSTVGPHGAPFSPAV